MSILETTRYGASAKILGRPRAPRFLAQGANFDSSAPMARGASLGKSLSLLLKGIITMNHNAILHQEKRNSEIRKTLLYSKKIAQHNVFFLFHITRCH